ncbi:hypothetical protein [Diplocloster agilis]|uniref:hypothetical protein n=1 Tax=Diplocloster agilis TaxID=2850323 RepID=UPI000820DF5B|nr:hypothetical protein [Suonthocola fibrivorans]MCU6733362.1 hypothetical protein [Suonthocola fibrivorans]SCI88807.1 Uncharacterised protein [uncultured Clostridium sp.]
MNKTELKKIIKAADSNAVYCYHEDNAGFVPEELVENTDGLVKLVFRPFDFATLAAVSEKVAEVVVPEDGGYHPELRDLLVLYYVLSLSANVKLGEFDAEEMYRCSLSPIGKLVFTQMNTIGFLQRLETLCDQKIEYRKSMALKGKDGFGQLMETLVDRAKAGDFSWMQQVGGAGRFSGGNGTGTIVSDNAAKNDRKDSEMMSSNAAVGSDSSVMDRLDRKGVVA